MKACRSGDKAPLIPSVAEEGRFTPGGGNPNNRIRETKTKFIFFVNINTLSFFLEKTKCFSFELRQARQSGPMALTPLFIFAVWGASTDRSNTGIVGSNPAQGMDVCPPLCSALFLSGIDTGLVTG
jgi:hypothetical protein